MNRIMVAWELGGGYGHLAETVPLALALRAHGHEVVFALRDLTRAGLFLGPHGLPFHQAPIALPGAPATPSPVSLADILPTFGYGDAAVLGNLMQAWRRLFTVERIDFVVTDFAPTALLAARAQGLPAAAFGTGFSVPPAARPVPGIRLWDPPGEPAIADTEQRMLAIVNAALARQSSPSIAALHEIWSAATPLLRTHPEIAHYGTRPGTTYYGSISGTLGGTAPVWPAGPGPKVFGYLTRHYGPFPALCGALSELGVPVLLHARDIGAADARRLQTGKLLVTTQRLDMEKVLREADLVVTHASHGTVAAALRAGLPNVSFPMTAEQALLAFRLHTQQLTAMPEAMGTDRARLLAVLVAGLEDRTMAAQSKSFAARYATMDTTMDRLVGDCLRIIAG